jgi:hypothetical protein
VVDLLFEPGRAIFSTDSTPLASYFRKAWFRFEPWIIV